MRELRHRLMLAEVEKRLSSAEILKSCGDCTDSGYLLQLLAFEILLKLLYEKFKNEDAPETHQYLQIFEALPAATRREIVKLAEDRICSSTLSNPKTTVLTDLGKNFIALRYPYSKYDRMTEDHYASVGENWLASGAVLSKATFRYHPEELYGLIYALRTLTCTSSKPT